ncbi:MAG: lipid-A-disaccharide synthase [Alphaproteobacteria bacterium]
MSTNKLKVYLIAGEPSGDLLGSRLMNAFAKKTSGNIEFFGVGGDTMEEAGLKSLFDVSDLAVMGLLEVVPSIPKVLSLIKKTVNDIKATKPDVVISIDSWSFCSRVHKQLKKQKLNIPQVHYVAPQVWAWKKKRAKTMHEYIDLLLTLLPSEPQYFTPYNLTSKFVGHPVIESDVVKANVDDFYKNFDINKNKEIITILPGSRKTEVSKLLPIFLKVAEKLYQQNNNIVFALPTVKTVSKLVKSMINSSNLPIVLLESQEERYAAFKASQMAIAASGTVALELAIVDVPHLVAYKVSTLTAFILRKITKLGFVNLTNILLNKEVIPEILQEECNENKIFEITQEILQKEFLYQSQINNFIELKKVLGFGKQTPSENAVDEILKFIK